jgi:hypothetical protein
VESRRQHVAKIKALNNHPTGSDGTDRLWSRVESRHVHFCTLQFLLYEGLISVETVAYKDYFPHSVSMMRYFFMFWGVQLMPSLCVVCVSFACYRR